MAGPSGVTSRLALPYPIPDDNVDAPRDTKALAEKLDLIGVVPVGAMMMWPTSTAPAGWAMCNGAQLDAATYPQLAALLGQTAGKVALPNLSGRVPLGVGSGHALGQAGGAETVTLTKAQMPVHDHSPGTGGATIGPVGVAPPSHIMADQYNTYQSSPPGYTATDTFFVTDHTHGVYADGGGQAHDNMPPFMTVNYIIRVG
jgi:microcystin-dependent protein